jgi:hypothetical protein
MRRLFLTLTAQIWIAALAIPAQATHSVDRTRAHNQNKLALSSSPVESAKDQETRRENDRALAVAASTSTFSAKDEETRRENARALASANPRQSTTSTQDTGSVTGTPAAATPSGGNGFFFLVCLGLCFAGYKIIKARGKQLPRTTPDETAGQLAVLDELRKGTKPTVFTLNGFYPQKGESVIWAFNGVQHLHQAAHSEWVGRSGGLSVRVMKGVWYRSGRNHGHSEQHSSMDDQGVGTLVLTTKALCFVGVNSARLPFAHILALETFSNGIGLDTDYAKNTKHQFGRLSSENVAFLKSAMDLVSANAT